MSNEVKNYSTTLASEPITIDNRPYEVRELTAKARAEYLKALSATIDVRTEQIGDDRKGAKRLMAVKNLAGADIDLLQRTVWYVPEDGEARLVKRSEVESWGSRMTEEITKIANRLNGLDKSEDELEDEAGKN